ncbi:MAG: hypothetical protein CMK59_12660 [Proteobacteria bacterium]|nr:hypothetical protein [Pseudomonadota bacterium]
MIFLFSQLVWAECGEGFSLRYSVPSSGIGNMPTQVQPLLSFLGDGSQADISIALFLEEEGETTQIPIEEDVGCYIHESSTEKHCNWRIIPEQDLEENSSYLMRISPTISHPEQGWTDEVTFSTGSSRAQIDVTPPQLELLKYGPRDDFGIDECDWPDAYSYEFWAYPQTSDSLKSYLNVYEVTQSGEELYQHIIFIEPDMSSTDFRQVLEPGTEGPRCYFIQHRLITGEISETSETLCHDGSIFPSTGEDDPIEDSGEPTEDTPEPEETGNTGSKKRGGTTVEVEQGGGCGSGSEGLLLMPLFLFRKRNKRSL